MLELAKRLRDLKDLVSPAYYGHLKDIAFAALAGDWKTVHTVVFDLARKYTADLLFPEFTSAGSSEVNPADLDAALAQLEQATVTTAAEPAMDPGTWLLIIGAVTELIKLIRERRKPK